MSQTNARLQGGAIILPRGASPGNIGVGESGVFLDADGVVKAQDATGTKSTLGGGIGWDAIQWTRIQALLGTQVDNYIWSDMLNPNEYDITVGTAPGAQLAAATGGVIRLSGGAGSGYVQFAGMKQSGPVIKPVPNQKTSSWAAAWRFRLPNAVVASQFTEMAFYASGNGSCTTLLLNQAVSATVFHLRQDRTPDGGGVTDTACDATMTIGSGIAIGTWYDALMTWNASTQVLTAQINGVTTATSAVATNQPTEDGTSVLVDTNKANSIDVDAIKLAFKREP